MICLVVDATVAIKWVVSEAGSAEASALKAAELSAPDLLCAECADLIWTKVGRGELTADVARLAIDVLARADLQLAPMRNLVARAARLALNLDLPPSDCLYLALAEAEACPLVTTNDALVRQVAASSLAGLPKLLTLAEAAALVAT